MEIKRSGSQPSAKGPAEYFTGTVRVDPLFQAPDPARVVAASVTFDPGARTAWHTHPLGPGRGARSLREVTERRSLAPRERADASDVLAGHQGRHSNRWTSNRNCYGRHIRTRPGDLGPPALAAYLPATSFWNRGLPRSGSKLGSIFSQPGER
jgi:hypothetical protein